MNPHVDWVVVAARLRILGLAMPPPTRLSRSCCSMSRARTNSVDDARRRFLASLFKGDYTAAEIAAKVRDELWLHVPDALCADPCPEASDLLPCLLEQGHGGNWHRNRSSSWPTRRTTT